MKLGRIFSNITDDKFGLINDVNVIFDLNLYFYFKINLIQIEKWNTMAKI
jgi:hypothetical protein